MNKWISILVFGWFAHGAVSAQVTPPNLNLVANPSLEFNYLGNFTILDTTFVNNPGCWVGANIFPSFIFGKSQLPSEPLTGNNLGLLFIDGLLYLTL
jgi:hypothetical protein